MTLVALSEGVGRLEEDGSVAVLDLPARSLAELVAAGIGSLDIPCAQISGRCELGDAVLGSFVGPTATVWGVGLNYRSKELASGRTAPSSPTFFMKARSSVTPAGAPVVLAGSSTAVDLEAEIALLIGEHLFEATPERAEAALVGYAAANDVTARDVMRATGNPGLAKSFPSFGQFGAVVGDYQTVGGLDDVTLRSTVDGAVWQDDTGSGLLLGAAELVAHISRYAVLRPGDVVLTGTPAGTGDERGEYLRPGSTVEVVIGDLPALSATVEGSRNPQEWPNVA